MKPLLGRRLREVLTNALWDVLLAWAWVLLVLGSALTLALLFALVTGQ